VGSDFEAEGMKNSEAIKTVVVRKTSCLPAKSGRPL
jgi:large subunit ribosomal protein L33